MNKNTNHITKVEISTRNMGVVDFIRKEIAAKKQRHAAIRNAIDKEMIQKLKASGKVECSK
ncbi:hypothetical protein MD537_09675 [Flavihumibacter sediminis]|nr:hypothetical protein [Flavihumibacter sediminis]